MGLMQKILGAADPATSRRTQGDPRMKGAGRGTTTRATRGKVPPGRSRPAVGFGMRNSRQQPKTGMAKIMGALTGRR
jgi:hypothetical protein